VFQIGTGLAILCASLILIRLLYHKQLGLYTD